MKLETTSGKRSRQRIDEKRARRKQRQKQYAPLNTLTKPNVDTDAAAFYLNRKPQTLRGWACFGCGPIEPLRINGRLAWSVPKLCELTHTDNDSAA